MTNQKSMKRLLLIVTVSLIAASAGFLAGGWFFTDRLLDKYNGIASNNFSMALRLFRDDYMNRRITIFGEVQEASNFSIGDYGFVVIPTVADSEKAASNPEFCNMAYHINDMVVMLACHWIVTGDTRGDELLSKLKNVIPNFKLSAPDIDNVSLVDLKAGSAMMKSEASEWGWRMR